MNSLFIQQLHLLLDERVFGINFFGADLDWHDNVIGGMLSKTLDACN